MTEKAKNLFSFLGRMALSVALLAWLFTTQVKWGDTIRVIKQADPALLAWAFLLTVIIQMIVLLRWMIFMKALKLEAPFGEVFRYFFIGLFGNLFLPTAIGGDLVKAIGLSHGVGQKPKVFASIVLDRLSGFAGLVTVALISYLIGSTIIDAPSVIIPIAILTVLSMGVGGILFSRRIYAIGYKLFEPFPRIHKAIKDMHNDVLLMKTRKRTGLGCIGLSCILQVLSAYMYYVVGLALHLKVSLLHYLIFAPIVGAATMLPSIGGLGVREVGWKAFLTRVGVAPDTAVGLSLISFFFVIVCGLFGGIIYVSTTSSRRLQRAEENPAVR